MCATGSTLRAAKQPIAYTYYNKDGGVAWTWTQTVITNATIDINGNVTINQGAGSEFDDPTDKFPMATIPGPSSTGNVID